MSFQQGLSGLNGAAKNLDVIGNNVANANTSGFKLGSAIFGDVFAASLGGGGGTQVGIGTQITSVNQQFTQGNISLSNNPLDIAINGQGFFRMSDAGAITYTRNGGFSVDKEGYVVSSRGHNLTGFEARNGAIVPGVLVNLQLSSSDLLPKASTAASVGANLASTATGLPLAGFVATDPKTYNFSTASTLYDTLGQSHTMTMYFVKDDVTANQWYGSVFVDGLNADAKIAGVPQYSSLTFDNQGVLTGASNTVKGLTALELGNGAAALSVTMDYSDVTQFGSGFGVNSLSQDGFASGRLSGYNIGNDGIILGRYTNGQSQMLGQVALSNFVNPQGLSPLGDSMWAESATSGIPLTGAPGTASLGQVQSGAKEDSNVDLTAELVNMITAQRVYQANAQSIKAQDAVLQTLVNLK
ncbi:MAG: flagellar hook protein FlgE [Burkholderiales bacterium]|nr:flagellar hook protein FlgE [Burkholderiales bacterium]